MNKWTIQNTLIIKWINLKNLMDKCKHQWMNKWNKRVNYWVNKVIDKLMNQSTFERTYGDCKMSKSISSRIE